MSRVFGVDAERHLFRQTSDGIVDKSWFRQQRRIEEITAHHVTVIREQLVVGIVKTAKN